MWLHSDCLTEAFAEDGPKNINRQWVQLLQQYVLLQVYRKLLYNVIKTTFFAQRRYF